MLDAMNVIRSIAHLPKKDMRWRARVPNAGVSAAVLAAIISAAKEWIPVDVEIPTSSDPCKSAARVQLCVSLQSLKGFQQRSYACPSTAWCAESC